MYTHAHTFPPHSLSYKYTHTLTQPHYTPVSLSQCLVGLCSAPAREVKCRRAGPDCTVGGEGDGWLGVVVEVVVLEILEVGGGTWWETAAPGWRGLDGDFGWGSWGGLHNPGLERSKARVVLGGLGVQGEVWVPWRTPISFCPSELEQSEASRSDRLWPPEPLSPHQWWQIRPPLPSVSQDNQILYLECDTHTPPLSHVHISPSLPLILSYEFMFSIHENNQIYVCT